MSASAAVEQIVGDSRIHSLVSPLHAPLQQLPAAVVASAVRRWLSRPSPSERLKMSEQADLYQTAACLLPEAAADAAEPVLLQERAKLGEEGDEWAVAGE